MFAATRRREAALRANGLVRPPEPWNNQGIDRAQFSRELTAWIPPSCIAEVGARYERDPEDVLRQSTLVVGSRVLTNASEADLSGLVGDFLEPFALPVDLVHVTQSYAGSALSKVTLEWLASLRFDGAIEGWSSASGVPAVLPDGERSLMLVHVADGLADLIAYPLRMLGLLVDKLAVRWRDYASAPSGIFLVHSSNSSFGVHVEVRVAVAYGCREGSKAGVRAEPNALVLRYRAVTVVGAPPHPGKLLEAAREAARFQARETLAPIE